MRFLHSIPRVWENMHIVELDKSVVNLYKFSRE